MEVIKQIKTKFNHLLFMLSAFLLVFIPQKIYADGVSWQGMINTEAVKKPIEDFSSEFGILINGFMGLGIMTGVLVFIINAIKLASFSNNPGLRQMVIWRMFFSGICIAGLGGTMLIYNIIVSIAIG